MREGKGRRGTFSHGGVIPLLLGDADAVDGDVGEGEDELDELAPPAALEVVELVVRPVVGQQLLHGRQHRQHPT